MNGYLGEFETTPTPFDNYTEKDWALQYIFQYGQIDESHHKQWVLDQITRILNGTEVKVVQARWSDGQSEWRFRTLEPSREYLEWIEEYEEDGEYEYDKGVAP